MYELREVNVGTMRIEDVLYLSYHHRWEGAIRRISAGLRTRSKKKQRNQYQFWTSLHHKSMYPYAVLTPLRSGWDVAI